MVKKHLVALIFSSLLAVTGWAATPGPSVIATPPQPQWNELTIQQKSVLAPLGGDWDAMEYYRRKKWIGIAVRFPKMTPEEQQRIQGQMQEWTKLTPGQRQLAREKFQTVTQLPTEKKEALKQKWEEYSNLPEEEKEKHKQQATANPAGKTGRPAAAGVPPTTSGSPAGTGAASAAAPTHPNAGTEAPQPAATNPAADTLPRP
jgi:hypothetical protein